MHWEAALDRDGFGISALGVENAACMIFGISRSVRRSRIVISGNGVQHAAISA